MRFRPRHKAPKATTSSTLHHLWHLFLRDFWKTAASSQFDTPDKARYFGRYFEESAGGAFVLTAIGHHEYERIDAIARRGDGWNRPMLQDDDKAILDIGCGIGQTFAAWNTDVLGHRDWGLCVGMDVDESAILEATRDIDWGTFLLQGAERIPYPAATFDLVMGRVSLPYCDIPKTLREIHRTLKPGGRVWFTLHTREHTENCMRRSGYGRLRKMSVRFNSWLLNTMSWSVRIRGRCETWQDPESFVALLGEIGFAAEWSMGKDAAGSDVLRVEGVRL